MIMKKNILLLTILVLSGLFSSAQQLPANWYNLDLKNDSVYGVSTNKAYETILKGKKSSTIIVAVIDDGTDVDHPDLAGHIWTNSKEIPGNKIDDDNNGYPDDIHGWNYLGNADEDIVMENMEVTRIVRKYQSVFADSNNIKSQPEKYQEYLNAKSIYDKKLAEYTKTDERLNKMLNFIEAMNKKYAKDSLSVQEVAGYYVTDSVLIKMKERMITLMDKGTTYPSYVSELKRGYKNNKDHLDYHMNIAYDARKIIHDDYENINDKSYGNNHVKSPDGDHGTHVSGIIGATRGNEMGTDGVAANVQLMILRVVPNGDERDKDIALAIRYAADNGARIINMSFGKPVPYNKKAVDDAVKYAASKNVLLVHAAGNESLNLDVDKRYPNPNYLGEKRNARKNWLDVGANAADGNPGTFSNYGKKYVDLFAPGVKITSTLPNNGYGAKNGTSMASPVAAGVAALILSYYPQMTAEQLKKVLVKSVVRPQIKVKKPGTKDVMVKYKDLCITAGIINAYEAAKLADRKYGK
jgi:subtilisin family serine protease